MSEFFFSDENLKAFYEPNGLTYVYEANWGVWQSAVMAFDDRGERYHLITLLLSDEPLPPSARALLADLLSRHRLRGRELPAWTLPKLIKILRSDRELSQPARTVLTGMFEYDLLMRRPGRPRAPVWQRSLAESKLLLAKLEYQAARRYLNRRLTLANRKTTAHLHGISVEAFERELKGRTIGGVRRIRSRQKK